MTRSDHQRKSLWNLPRSGMELDGSSCTFLSCFSLNLGGGGGGGGRMVPDVVDDTIDILTVGDCITPPSSIPLLSTIVKRTKRGGVLPISNWQTREKVKAGQSVSSTACRCVSVCAPNESETGDATVRVSREGVALAPHSKRGLFRRRPRRRRRLLLLGRENRCERAVRLWR